MTAPSSAISRYVLNHTTYQVDLSVRLGSGAEGMVVAHPHDHSLCVKLFHPPTPGDKGELGMAAYRSRKVRAICDSGIVLPAQFTLPKTPAFNLSGDQAIGFAMRRVPPGYHKLAAVLDDSFKASFQFGLKAIAELYADIFDDLGIIHKHGLVIGDVNLGCLMFKPGEDRAWVDTDSWSYHGFPCLATTELFAHPDLYPNLVPGGTYVEPRPEHDRFAFAVALMLSAIPGAHPFSMGKHPKVHGLQERALAKITIFDPGVRVPPMVGSPEILSDEMLHAIIERVKRQTNAPMDSALLRTFAQEVTECSKCGTEYHASRRHCPTCHQITLVQAPSLVSYLIEELFAVKGSLLFAQVVDDNLYLVCRVGGKVQIVRVNENGASAMLAPALPNVPGAIYRFFGDCLVVCADPTRPNITELALYRINGQTLQPLNGTSTGVLAGESSVFGTSSKFLYRTASNALMRCSLFGPSGIVLEDQIAEVYQQQSWITVDRTPNTGREVIFGYDRALRNWEWFIIRGDANGENYQYHKIGDLGLRQGEAVEDFAVCFSPSSVLLAMVTKLSGRDYVRYVIIGLDGEILLNRTIDSSDDSFPHWRNLRGKLHQGKSVLHATPDGIVKQQYSDGVCTTLPGTTAFMSADARLTRLFGKVGIVRRGDVLVMTSKK